MLTTMLSADVTHMLVINEQIEPQHAAHKEFYPNLEMFP